MARPTKTGADYFSHDTSAFNDVKISILRARYGLEGYGFYWFMLEKIYLTEKFELDLSDDDISEDITLTLSLESGLKIEKFNEILNFCFKHKLFDKQIFDNKKVITSNGIKKRASCLIEKREYNKKRQEKNNNTSSSDSYCNNNNAVKERKEKESIEKDSIEKNIIIINSEPEISKTEVAGFKKTNSVMNVVNKLVKSNKQYSPLKIPEAEELQEVHDHVYMYQTEIDDLRETFGKREFVYYLEALNNLKVSESPDSKYKNQTDYQRMHSWMSAEIRAGRKLKVIKYD